MRAAHEAQVIPVTSRSITSTGLDRARSGDVVDGFIDAHDLTRRSIARLASVMIRSDSAWSSDWTALVTQ